LWGRADRKLLNSHHDEVFATCGRPFRPSFLLPPPRLR
jgi:hypothetical protein